MVTTVVHLPAPHPILNVLLCHTNRVGRSRWGPASGPHLERPTQTLFVCLFFYFALNHRVTVGGRFGVITDDDLGLTVLILVSIICFLFGLFLSFKKTQRLVHAFHIKSIWLQGHTLLSAESFEV